MGNAEYKYLHGMVKNPVKISYEEFIKLYEKSDKTREVLTQFKKAKGFHKGKWLKDDKTIKVKGHIVGTISARDDNGEEEYLKLAIVVSKLNKEKFEENLSRRPRNKDFPDDGKLHYAIVDFGMFDLVNYVFTSFNREPQKECREMLKNSPFKKIQDSN